MKIINNYDYENLFLYKQGNELNISSHTGSVLELLASFQSLTDSKDYAIRKSEENINKVYLIQRWKDVVSCQFSVYETTLISEVSQ